MRRARQSGFERLESYLVRLIQEKGADLDQPGAVVLLLRVLKALDWFAWGPYVRWDIRENELDRIGSWFDYLTDCLGFRFIVEYQNAYTRIDGYEHKDDWSFGFYIYLRAFGADSSSPLSGWQ